MLRLQKSELLLRFDALSNHPQLEALSHVNDGSYDWRVIETASEPLNEGLINLQDINGKLLKIAEAGITGTEVIHRQVYSYLLERMKDGCRGFGMMHEHTFGEFEVQIARVQTGFAKDHKCVYQDPRTFQPEVRRNGGY